MEDFQLFKELEQIKKERAAAIADINALLGAGDGIVCYYCKNFDKNSRRCNFSSEIGERGCRGEWRGLVKEEEK